MLARLKRLIAKIGIGQVSVDLGYRSQSTIIHWIKNNNIPVKCRGKVKEYLEVKQC